jgi:hypothetical protein
LIPERKPGWILNGPSRAYLARRTASRDYLRGAKPFVIQRGGESSLLPTNWEAISVRSFASVAALATALSRPEGLDADARAVLYDCEAWPFTPNDEQRDHAGFTRRAAELVRARGLTFITAPAVTLAKLLPDATERRYEDFLRGRFAADAARHADVYVVQAQGSLRDLPKYVSFVERATRQATAANPNIVVYAGISTNPSGMYVTAAEIVRAIDATRRIVQGYWFNVPAPSPYAPRVNAYRPDLAVDVFAELARRDPTH